jgi:RNA polymerase sigma factor (sigma-70 family)
MGSTGAASGPFARTVEVPFMTGNPTPRRAATPSPDDAHAAWVRRIIHQDEAALAALYRSLSTRVYRLALRLTRDTGTAEEVVEDVFWQVWRQAPRFDAGRGPVVGWVLQICRSRAIDALRAAGRNPLHSALDIDDPATEPLACDEAGPPARLDQIQLAEQVETALGALDPLRRQLVSLAFMRGYSQAEIAEQTGLPLGTVKSHLRRALATMKLQIEPTLRLPQPAP